jgi:hypothetical protein
MFPYLSLFLSLLLPSAGVSSAAWPSAGLLPATASSGGAALAALASGRPAVSRDRDGQSGQGNHGGNVRGGEIAIRQTRGFHRQEGQERLKDRRH